jgi:hypothetical protein
MSPRSLPAAAPRPRPTAPAPATLPPHPARHAPRPSRHVCALTRAGGRARTLHGGAARLLAYVLLRLARCRGLRAPQRLQPGLADLVQRPEDGASLPPDHPRLELHQLRPPRPDARRVTGPARAPGVLAGGRRRLGGRRRPGGRGQRRTWVKVMEALGDEMDSNSLRSAATLLCGISLTCLSPCSSPCSSPSNDGRLFSLGSLAPRLNSLAASFALRGGWTCPPDRVRETACGWWPSRARPGPKLDMGPGRGCSDFALPDPPGATAPSGP